MNRSRWIWTAVGLGAVALVVFLVVRLVHTRAEHDAAAQKSGHNGPVPVSAVAAATGNIPIYLQGIGTVQAYNTATLRTRVDGQLEKVFFTEGQMINKGDPVALIDPRPYQAALDQVIAKKAQDEATLVSAKKDLARYKILVAQKLQQEQTLDQQVATVDSAAALVRGDAANIESAQTNLAYTKITAPFSGRVGLRLVDVGNIVHAADTTGLVTLTQLQPIAALFTLPEQNVGDINGEIAKSGDTKLEVDALAADNKTVIAKGELAVVNNQIDATTGTIQLKAIFPNADNKLWPGQFVNARLLLTVRQNAIVVPSPAIQRGPDGTFVYVLQGDQAQVRNVKVAQIQAGQALIDQGLNAGEQVVTDGQYKLQPGSKVVLQGASGGKGGAHGNKGGAAPAPTAAAPASPGAGTATGGAGAAGTEKAQGRPSPAESSGR